MISDGYIPFLVCSYILKRNTQPTYHQSDYQLHISDFYRQFDGLLQHLLVRPCWPLQINTQEVGVLLADSGWQRDLLAEQIADGGPEVAQRLVLQLLIEYLLLGPVRNPE